MVANTFIWLYNCTAHIDGVQFFSIFAIKMLLQLVFPKITVAILRNESIYAKKYYLNPDFKVQVT